tara:strand:- start:64013 stop:64414 length:402 start_codon:yes stop_codon:yes gene_type:complete
MKKFLIAALAAMCIGTLTIAATSPSRSGARSSGAVDVAQIASNCVVTGLISGPKIKHSAIVNDTIIWQGKIYAVDAKTGKIRAWLKSDKKARTTSVELTNVSGKKATFIVTERFKDDFVINHFFHKVIKRSKR